METYLIEKLSRLTGLTLSGSTRIESDLIGKKEIPIELYFGVQTLRAVENFNISKTTVRDFSYFVRGLAEVKKAAALANKTVGLMKEDVCNAICKACDEIISGKFHENFIVDLIQGGAGTSTNMCANEVIANRALEHLGKSKGEYKYCSPNDHVNLAQSTNDAYPTSIHIAILYYNKDVTSALKELVLSFRNKAVEFKDAIKMGRTQLQDAFL